MKYLKLYENFDNIENICRRYDITHYLINQDGSIDVSESVDLSIRQLRSIPLKFNKVIGEFICAHNYLTTLKGSPRWVRDDCSFMNNNLSTLKGITPVIGGSLMVGGNRLKKINYLPDFKGSLHIGSNYLTSLSGLPNEIHGSFTCRINSLTSLEGCPQIIDGSLDCEFNNLTTLEFGPQTVKEDYFCRYNKLTDFIGFPKYFYGIIFSEENPVYEIIQMVNRKDKEKFVKYLNEFDVIRGGNKIVEQRLEEAYWMTMKEELPMNKRTFKNYTLI